jgi:hypothetical protein
MSDLSVLDIIHTLRLVARCPALPNIVWDKIMLALGRGNITWKVRASYTEFG